MASTKSFVIIAKSFATIGKKFVYFLRMNETRELSNEHFCLKKFLFIDECYFFDIEKLMRNIEIVIRYEVFDSFENFLITLCIDISSRQIPIVVYFFVIFQIKKRY